VWWKLCRLHMLTPPVYWRTQGIDNWQPSQRAAQHGPSWHCCCFDILRKCQNKLVCLIFEMLSRKELKPTLNKHYDSIHTKLFVLIQFFCFVFFIFLVNLIIVLLIIVFKCSQKNISSLIFGTFYHTFY